MNKKQKETNEEPNHEARKEQWIQNQMKELGIHRISAEMNYDKWTRR